MSKAIRAYAYLRKSTADPEEKSIGDQHTRVRALVHPSGRPYEIVRVFADPATPGWRRGAKRPDYFRMVSYLRDRRDGNVEAIVFDDCDRLSRADSMETVSDVQTLRELGVRTIHSGNPGQGVFDLTRDVATVAMRLSFVANASHEHCTRLSRRISEKRRDSALAGKRTGGAAPYGFELTDDGGLKPGDQKERETVLWIFTQYVNHAKSICWITGELTRRRVPAPRGGGGGWATKTVGQLLRNEVYVGTFTYGKRPCGHFHRLNAQGQVVQAGELGSETGRVYTRKGAYRSIIPVELFDAAQARLARRAKDRSIRKRQGYALTSILKCDHCGGPLYGVKLHDYVVYRCGANVNRGSGSCGSRQVREDVVLPFVMKKLSELLGQRVEELLSSPPADVLAPAQERRQADSAQRRQRDELARKIDTGTERILDVADKLTRQALDRRISAMREELAQLDLQLGAVQEQQAGYTPDELKALREWWKSYCDKGVKVPIDAKKLSTMKPIPLWAYSYRRNPDEEAVVADPRAVNDSLAHLGCEVRLRWETRQVPTQNGKVMTRHVVTRGRFRIDGQKSTTLCLHISGGTVCRSDLNLTLARKLLDGVDMVFSGADLT